MTVGQVGNAVHSLSPGQYKITGELNFTTVPHLFAESNWVESDASAELSVDLSDVTRADSAGLSLLLSWVRRAHAHRKTLAFSHVPDQLRNIARVSGVAELLAFETAPESGK